MNKKILSLVLIFLVLTPFANAITGSIGNAKAIVTVDLKQSDVLERTVLVRNVNNVSLNVKLEAADDLEGITEIIDKEFTLEPGEEKQARFKVNIPGEGTYNGNIVIFFKPPEGKGAGVALQANLIIKAVNGIKKPTKIVNNSTDNPNNQTDNNSNINNLITGETVLSKENIKSLDSSIVIFLVLVAVIAASGFIILIRRI